MRAVHAIIATNPRFNSNGKRATTVVYVLKLPPPPWPLRVLPLLPVYVILTTSPIDKIEKVGVLKEGVR